LHTNIADSVERLTAIHKETREQKAARRGISARLMTDVTRHIPASTQLLAARLAMRSEMAGRMTNVCISNVPGPQIPVYMNGATLVNQMGLGPLADRMGLFIAVTSYNGKITFSATSCRRTMPDIDFFLQCVKDSFSELVEAASSLPNDTPAKAGKKSKSKKKVSTKKRSASNKVTQEASTKKTSRKKAGKKKTKKVSTKK
jgi:hypothetical protein